MTTARTLLRGALLPLATLLLVAIMVFCSRFFAQSPLSGAAPVSALGHWYLADEETDKEAVRCIFSGGATYKRFSGFCSFCMSNQPSSSWAGGNTPGGSISSGMPRLCQLGSVILRGASRKFPALHSSACNASLTTCSFSVACMLHVE